MGMMLYDNARRAVAQLLSVDEVKEHLDQSAAVQEYARRAKNKELESKAAEYRVYCERRVGEFSAAAAAIGNKGGRPSKTGADTTPVSRRDVAAKVDVEPSTLIRKHEPLAAIPESEFDEAVQTAKANNEIPTARRVMEIHHSTKSPENPGADQHNTPDEIIALSSLILGGIDLDPCSDAGKNVPAKEHFTFADDGLNLDWTIDGKATLVYMNPPYSEARKWVEKLVYEDSQGRIVRAIALLPARPDTQWFRALRDFPVCFIKGRLTFKGQRDPAPFPSCLFYVGPEEAKFVEIASSIGDVYVRANRA